MTAILWYNELIIIKRGMDMKETVYFGTYTRRELSKGFTRQILTETAGPAFW